jgi:hypothetical protein
MITQAATGSDCKSLVIRLRRCKSFIIHSLIAQQVEREAVNFDVTGSIPVQRVMDDKRRHSAGKGDKPRPVDYKKWSDNWDRIFGKKKKKIKKNAN